MSILVIAISGLISMVVAYYVVSPFISEVSESTGNYPDYFSDSRGDSYKEALENLDYALESKTITEEEFENQKSLLLKDAVNLISDKA